MTKHLQSKRLDAVSKTHAYEKGFSEGSREYGRAIADHLAEPFLMDSRGGDITTEAVIPVSTKVRASLLAKQEGIFAGMSDVEFFFKKPWTLSGGETIDLTDVEVLHITNDGAHVTAGMALAVLKGPINELLAIERTVLNFLQRMSGVATMARQYADACAGFDVLVCSTRKTPFGLLDKKACLIGGAGTHRLGLGDAVLVKDTHLALIHHDFGELGKRLLAAKKLGRFVEVEVESVEDAWKAAAVLDGVHRQRKVPCFIMLDNMHPKKIGEFMNSFKDSPLFEHIFVEASGGITLKNIREFAEAGVDVISVGAMTHSAPALDISLKISSI